MSLKIALVCMVVLVGVLAALPYLERKHRRKKHPEASPSFTRRHARNVPEQTAPTDYVGDVTRAARPATLSLNDSADREILRISVPDSKFLNTQTWKKVELANAASWIEPLIADAAAAIPLPLIAALQSSRTFHVVFEGAGHLMRAKDHTGFRSILVDKTGIILSHGKLVPLGHRFLNAAAAWELAALVTQRKFLIDIDRKLLALKSGVAEIESLLKNERIGRLQADTRYIAETVLLLTENPSFLYQQPSAQHILEDIERGASGDVRAYLLDLQSLTGRLEQLSLSSFWSADLDPFSREIESATGTLRAAAFALSVRCFAAGMLPHYAEDHQRLRARLADITTLWHALNESSKAIQRLALTKLDAMSEIASRQSTIDAKKQSAKAHMTKRFGESARLLKSVLNDSKLLADERNLLEAGAKPIHMKLEVNRNGKLIAAHVSEV